MDFTVGFCFLPTELQGEDWQCTCDYPKMYVTILVDESSSSVFITRLKPFLVDFASRISRERRTWCRPLFAVVTFGRRRFPRLLRTKQRTHWVQADEINTLVMKINSSSTYLESGYALPLDTLVLELAFDGPFTWDSPLCNTFQHTVLITPNNVEVYQLPATILQTLRGHDMQMRKSHFSLLTDVELPLHPDLRLPVLGRVGMEEMLTLPSSGQSCSFRTKTPLPSMDDALTANPVLSSVVLSSGGAVFSLSHVVQSNVQRCSLASALSSFIRRAVTKVREA